MREGSPSRHEKPSLERQHDFGEHDTSRAAIFNKLDEDGDGEVSMKDFQKNFEDAFLAAVEQPENEDDSFCPHPQAVAMDRPAADPPIPPPMTREMLYRSVYDQIDTKRTGYISQKDLVRACSKGRRSSIAKIFGENATKDAIKVFSDMDTDNTGMVSWKQFFEQAEEALVHKPAQRMAAPRRKCTAAAWPRRHLPLSCADRNDCGAF